MTMEELEKEIKTLARKNGLLEQSLKQDHILRQRYNDSIELIKKKDKELQELNETLENKVLERTKELKEAYEREHQLKGVLHMVADVNEYLVGAMSVESIAKNSIERICKYEHYKLCFFAMVLDDKIEIIYKSQDIYGLIPQIYYPIIKNYKDSLIFSTTFEAIEKRTKVVQYNTQKDATDSNNRRSSDFQYHSVISIPIQFNNDSVPYGIFTIFSDNEQLDNEEISLLENLGSDISLAMNINKHRSISEKLELEKISNYEETILAFVDMIEQRDAYTAGHTLRVASYCKLIAKSMAIPENESLKLERAAILHDIGKVVTPDSILLKPGKLSAVEYDLIKQHAVSGYKMLSNIVMYQELAGIIKYHHEHYDGSGYPEGVKGDAIGILTHILIVADAFDAMTTNRIYKGRKTNTQALEEIKSLSGIHFHPEVVEHTLKTLDKVTIDTTDQMPHSELERKRFSYFFNDSLTGAHNEQYLKMILNKEKSLYRCFHIIFMKKFSHYNKVYGWGKGDELLIEIANELKELYPDAIIFRIHGDDFIILNITHLEIDQTILFKKTIFRHKEIHFDLKHFDMNDFVNIDNFLLSIL